MEKFAIIITIIFSAQVNKITKFCVCCTHTNMLSKYNEQSPQAQLRSLLQLFVWEEGTKLALFIFGSVLHIAMF